MEDITEIWRSIPEYENVYQVSNLGNVRRVYLHKTKQLKQCEDKDWYFKVRLSMKNRQTNFFVHRLVAMCFIPNSHNYPVVNHKDENKKNNCVNNLEWCSVQYNTRYNNMPKRRAKNLRKAILQIDFDGNIVKEWDSRSDIEKALGFSGGTISACCLGYHGFKTAYGYVWKYKQGAV